MKLPFLRYLPGLGSPPVRQVVGAPGSISNSPAEAALHYLLAELPELLLAAVLDLPTGQLRATYAADRAYQPSLLAASVAAVVQQAQLLGQGQAGEEPAEVLLTLASQLYLVRLRPGGQQVLYLAVGSHDTNLALLRQLAQQAVQLLDAAA
ncbi:hypothetical protein GKZ68_16260 [Hymenobacter sp. BRD128]|uniref:hypothetical protein n=1 Tax=Hymenobacter sp. BRD128 TaxID=2675878 RepID=UPI001564DE46|nr:hypothetical protein [Hymenobacter sp. BRD128]QKG58036.1 hypothetical protein GKZ68_16260 [Hymenobacter sp. BRD128]